MTCQHPRKDARAAGVQLLIPRGGVDKAPVKIQRAVNTILTDGETEAWGNVQGEEHVMDRVQTGTQTESPTHAPKTRGSAWVLP